jgi:hypothetical protein
MARRGSRPFGKRQRSLTVFDDLTNSTVFAKVLSIIFRSILGVQTNLFKVVISVNIEP